MSERFSRKEFIRSRLPDYTAWHVVFTVAGMLLLAAGLLWIFPMEKYCESQIGRSSYGIVFLALCIIICWYLLRQSKSQNVFNRCPACGEKIFVSFAPVHSIETKNKSSQKGNTIFNISLSPHNMVMFNNGLCPHCNECIWKDESEFQGGKIPLARLDKTEWQDLMPILCIAPLLIAAVALWMWLALPWLKINVLATLLLLFALLVIVFRIGWSITFYFNRFRCPACGAMWFDTDFEKRTGRCHHCGELVVDFSLPDAENGSEKVDFTNTVIIRCPNCGEMPHAALLNLTGNCSCCGSCINPLPPESEPIAKLPTASQYKKRQMIYAGLVFCGSFCFIFGIMKIEQFSLITFSFITIGGILFLVILGWVVFYFHDRSTHYPHQCPYCKTDDTLIQSRGFYRCRHCRRKLVRDDAGKGAGE